jgi:hypothetical protein
MSRFRQVLSGTHRWVGRRELWLVLLVIFAVCYFGSYYRHGLNFRDEGGTVTLVAKRLLEGERPIRDVALGYNVLWYYPIVALFKVFGVNFVLLRAYCFLLSTVAAVLGFLTIERISRRPWLAFLTSVPVVLVPGMTFKNYMPLLVVANIYLLTMFMLGSRRQEQTAADAVIAKPPFRWGWLLAGAIVLGLTYLIRIDLGMFFSALWIGASVLLGLAPKRPAADRLAGIIGGPAILVATVFALHWPVYADAQRRDFDRFFLRQYTNWPKEIVGAVQHRLGIGGRAIPHIGQAARKETNAPAESATNSVVDNAIVSAKKEDSAVGTPETSEEKKKKANRDVLKRKGLRDFLTADETAKRLLPPLLYAPLLTLLPLVLWSLIRMARSWTRGDSFDFRNATAALLLCGGALTAFPQYFFFRPDAPHLSEFSPGFWIGATGALLLLCYSSERRRWPIPGVIIAALLTIHAAVYLVRMVPDRWTGTIAARFGRTRYFEGANGVNVYLNKKEWTGTTDLVKVINAHSKPGEYLVAYPYHPSINVVADRPTYERDVYVDNAIRPPRWEQDAIERFEEHKPAVIAISEWAINGTEDSRFSMWAPRTKTWVQTNYVYQGTYLEFEIYTRPSAAGAVPPAPVR